MSEQLFLHYELESFSLEKEDQYLEWLGKLCTLHKLEPECINYIFCDDEYLLKINKEYLDHDYYTDIITFPISKEPLCVDIFISITRVNDNAKSLSLDPQDELKRVMAHGILHIAGFNDKTEAETLAMRKEEDLAIAQF